MGCENPVFCNKPGRPKGPYDCGNCLGCGIKRQAMLVGLIMLEAAQHQSTQFVTLTLDDKHLLEHGLSLRKDVLQKFLHRLRKQQPRLTLIYAAAGEYGGRTRRPHYHLILFGFPYDEPTIKKAWTLGFVAVRPFTRQNALYLTKDQVKHVLNKGRTPAPEALAPPFYLTSKGRRGSKSHALGMTALPELASVLLTMDARRKHPIEDVPTTFQMGKKRYPLPTHRRRKLREQIGLPANAPPIANLMTAISQLETWKKIDLLTAAPGMARFRQQLFKDEMLNKHRQRNLNRDARRKIYRGTL